jgi:hypothetical protein
MYDPGSIVVRKLSSVASRRGEAQEAVTTDDGPLRKVPPWRIWCTIPTRRKAPPPRGRRSGDASSKLVIVRKVSASSV